MINDPTLSGNGAEVADATAPLETLPGGGDPPANGGNGNGNGLSFYDGPSKDISEELRASYLGYAMSTIVSRALPDVRDGLKPVHRHILYAMRELGLSPNTRHLKSAKVVGETMGNYHPHGDQSIYMTMVRMAQPFSLRYPLVDGQGNFGCFTGDTKIKLLDGTDKSFEELAALGPDARFSVYSVNAEGRVVVGEGRNARITRRQAALVEVVLDNGERIRCTPDHRFLLRDGKTYKEAQYLTPDIALKAGKFVGPSPKAFEGQAQQSPVTTSGSLLGASRHIVSVSPIEETADVYDITVDEHHNFLLASGVFVHNSVDDDPPAAMRYTEARLTALAMEMMEDIEKDTVDFIPTYDNERREPSILPGKFPNLICNGSSGIAVGMATNMPPHNLREICDAAAYLLDHPNATMEDLMRFVPGPDFPTHGLILGSKGIKSAYATGRGAITMQAKTSIEPMDNGKSAIVISELPYQVIKKKLIEDIADLVKEKKVEGITAVNDYSDKTGMRVVVELRRDVMPQKILNYLLKHTNLRLNFGVILLSLVDNGRGPKTLPLRGLLQEYLDHRRIIITRRTRFELGRAKARAHILEGLQIAVQFLDEVIAIIRASNSTEIARTRLIERFAFSGIQAESILNMQLRQLTGLEQEKIENEYKDLLKEIARLEDILSDPRRVDALVKADLKFLKDKFGDDRRTRIIPTEAEEINIEDLIADEEMLITITRDGYIRRLPLDSFPSQHRGGKGRIAGKTKEEDNFEHFFKASTHDYILFFTDRGRVYRLKAFEVPQTSRQAMGTAIINLIQIQSDERITATIPIRDLRSAEGYLLMVTERGEVKRTAISEYANLRANGLVTFDLEPIDSLKWVKHTNGDKEVLLTTVRGMAIRFPETDVPSRGRAAGGVRGVTLDGPSDRVVAVDLANEDAEVLVVSENGYGKRTALSEYRIQSRGGKGIKTMDLTDKTGVLVAACILTKESIADQRLVIVTENGIGIRIKVGEVRVTSSRSAQGVKLIELNETDRVKTVECIDVSKKDADAAD